MSSPIFFLKPLALSERRSTGEVAMRCVVSAAKSVACSALLLLGAVVVAGFGIGAAHANEPEAASARSWCVARSDAAPDCVHSDLVSCGIAALLKGGYCFKDEQAAAPSPTVAAAPSSQKRSATRRKAPTSQQDELFREFEQWKRTTAQ
jgi:hypothetical protein